MKLPNISLQRTAALASLRASAAELGSLAGGRRIVVAGIACLPFLGALTALGPIPLRRLNVEVERPAWDEETPAARPSLDEIRSKLAHRNRGDSVKSLGPIGLGGFNWAEEIDIGRGRRAIAVSCNVGGGILLFDSLGRMSASRRTWEIVSVQHFDFDEDGSQEIVTEQRDGVGTGMEFRNYHVYGAAESGFAHLWQGKSFARDGTTESQGFIRLVAGVPARLVRIIGPVGSGHFEQQVYVLRKGRLVPLKEIGPAVR